MSMASDLKQYWNTVTYLNIVCFGVTLMPLLGIQIGWKKLEIHAQLYEETYWKTTTTKTETKMGDNVKIDMDEIAAKISNFSWLKQISNNSNWTELTQNQS
jgi:hypothetical protein